MTCAACVSRLEQALGKVDGVKEAVVNLSTEKASIAIDPTQIGYDTVIDVVQRTGFNVGKEHRVFLVEGMTCAACANRVADALLDQPGVVDAQVNVALDRADVTLVRNAASDRQLEDRVKRAGYRLVSTQVSDERSVAKQRQREKAHRTLLISTLMCVPFLIQMVAQFIGWEEIHLMPGAEVALATPLQFLIGARFYKSAYNALRGFSANMDVLVVLGTSAAYLYSWHLMITLGEAAEGELYFEASAVILTLVLVGKYLEERAKHATSAALRELLRLRPQKVRVCRDDGSVIDLPIEELCVGDAFECRPGDRIATDGIVISGQADVDESLVTGESKPLHKFVGSRVIEGSINVDGLLRVNATAVGENSTIQKIVSLIEQAQIGKIAVQRLVDRVSAIFVPIVMGIAGAVFLVWLGVGAELGVALTNAVSVLVIACPCALGLATPTAIMTGTGAAARAGILFRDLEALETLRNVEYIAFDKTGTLTVAKPSISEITELHNRDTSTLLSIAASMQQGSTHPIASAFLNEAHQRRLTLLPMTDFVSTVAAGIAAKVDGRVYRLGNERLLGSRLFEGTAEDPSKSYVWLADEDRLLGRFALDDTLRTEAKSAIEELSRRGFQTLMLSGDSVSTAREVSETLGITQVHACLTPGEKVAHLQRLAGEHRLVAMVGDGINDAPALAAASVGIALGSGTGVAIEIAPVTLMRVDLTLVSAAIDVSKATFRKIKQNLFWAFIYNVIMLPMASLGFLNPTIAGAAMALSSVSVVVSSLWLKSWKPRVLSSSEVSTSTT